MVYSVCTYYRNIVHLYAKIEIYKMVRYNVSGWTNVFEEKCNLYVNISNTGR